MKTTLLQRLLANRYRKEIYLFIEKWLYNFAGIFFIAFVLGLITHSANTYWILAISGICYISYLAMKLARLGVKIE